MAPRNSLESQNLLPCPSRARALGRWLEVQQEREKPSGGTHGDPRDTGLPSSPHALGAVYPRTYAQLPVTAQLPQWIRQGQPRPSGQGPSSVIEVCPDLKNGIHALYYSSYTREDITDQDTERSIK